MARTQKRLNKTLDVNLIGQYGSGKGTQATYLVREFGLQHFSPGQALRDEIKEQTELGKRAQKIVEAGELVSASIVRELFERALGKLTPGQGIVADGLTRNFEQKKMFDSVMRDQGRTPIVIFINVSRETAFDRLSKRKVCAGCGDVPVMTTQDEADCRQCGGKLVTRHDDQPDLIKKRLDLYDTEIAPVVEAYRSEGALEEVDGEPAPEKVHASILAVLARHGFTP
ncbi:MAG: nucleoside monophosphate kinase [Candidatus Andersenbacteria bacterium]